MRLLADENVPVSAVRALRTDGHDVVWMTEANPGSNDLAVLDRARLEARILLTLDRDFGELIFLRGALAPPGLVFVRMVPPDAMRLVTALRWLVSEAGVPLEGRFVVLDVNGARFRPLP